MNTPKGGDASTPEPRKKLPVQPSLEHLQKQAKRRAKQNPSLKLAEAQHLIARDYGCKNWAELAHVVETMLQGADQLANVKREFEALPKAARAVDTEAVRKILSEGTFTQHDLDAGLAHALWYGDEANWPERKALADLLIEHGADPDGQYGSAYGPIVFGTAEGLDPDGLQYLIEAGADITFPPIQTKYGKVCVYDHTGTYVRGRNERKHRYIDILLANGGYLPPVVSPPILAIHRGDAPGLAKLLEAEPDLISRRFPDMPYGNIALRGATLLHCAVEFGEIACVEELLKRYADINAKADVIDGIGGQTPVFHAVNTNGDGNFSSLEYLAKRVGQGIDMSVRATWLTYGEKQPKPMTPLEYAESAAASEDARKWRKRIDEELVVLRTLDHGAQLKSAILSEDEKTVERLLQEWPGLLTPALWPVAIFQAKSLAITRLLLDRGLNPDECSAPRKPLHLAVYQCLPDIVELLIARGADVNLRNPLDETPLELLDAYESRPVGDPDTARIRRALLGAGAIEDLTSIVRAGDVDRLREMLLAEPSLAETDAEIGSPLFMAARSGRVEVARLLLEFGANPNLTNAKGNTALWFAAQSGAEPAENRIAVMEALLAAGAEINRRCEDGSTALSFAAWRGPVEVPQFLLNHGAFAWHEDDAGKLPKDYAAGSPSKDKEEIVKLFSGLNTEGKDM